MIWLIFDFKFLSIFSGTVTEPQEMSVKITSHNVDAVKREKLNQYFQEEVKNYNASSQTEGLGDFLGRFRDKYNIHIKAVGLGSLEVRVECPTLESLEHLKSDYCSGYIDEMAEKCILTDDVRQKLNLKNVSLKAVIRKEDYDRCRKSFLGPVRSSSEVINPGTCLKCFLHLENLKVHRDNCYNISKLNLSLPTPNTQKTNIGHLDSISHFYRKQRKHFSLFEEKKELK